MSEQYIILRDGMPPIGPFDSFEEAEKFILTYQTVWSITSFYTPEEFVSSYTIENTNHAVD